MENMIQYEYPTELWNIIKSFILIPKVDKTKINPHAICMKTILEEIELFDYEQDVNHEEILNDILNDPETDEDVVSLLGNQNLLENETYLSIYNSFNSDNCTPWIKLILFEDNRYEDFKPFGLYSSLLMISNKLKNNYHDLVPFVQYKFKYNVNNIDNYSSIYDDLLCNKPSSYLDALEFLYKLQRVNFEGGQLYAYENFNMRLR